MVDLINKDILNIAIIFFNRPIELKKVLDCVQMANPDNLFFIQDGARENNPDDIEKIEECRKLVDSIEWECNIYKNYSDINLGCGVRPYTGITWVFENVDRAIILEDDCIPAKSFFPFCKELLEKYKEDKRVCMISGLNHIKESPFCKESYSYAISGAIGGWATWKNRWNYYDYAVKGIENNDIVQYMLKTIKPSNAAKQRVAAWKNTNRLVKEGEKLSYWDHQWGFVKYSQRGLAIIPKYNQICNIGIGDDSTHCIDIKKEGSIFYMETKELQFPLDHPKFFLQDLYYDEKIINMLFPSKWEKIPSRIFNKMLRMVKIKK